MCGFAVLGLAFLYQAKRLARGTYTKWPILCGVGHIKPQLNQSVSLCHLQVCMLNDPYCWIFIWSLFLSYPLQAHMVIGVVRSVRNQLVDAVGFIGWHHIHNLIPCPLLAYLLLLSMWLCICFRFILKIIIFKHITPSINKSEKLLT